MHLILYLRYGTSTKRRILLLLAIIIIIIIIIMGAKKSASKDRGYVTASEWQRDGGGKTIFASSSKSSNRIQKLPFHCCALSFLPFGDHPVVSLKSGALYDLDAVVPYVMKHKKDPVTGEAMKTSDLKPVKLKKCSKNDDDDFAHKYECPILGSEFTNATKICVVKKTGNNNNNGFYSSFFLSLCCYCSLVFE